MKLEHKGDKGNGTVLLQILLPAASRVVSIFVACRDLADASSDDTVLDALSATLPDVAILEPRLNRGLSTELPKALTKKSRKIATGLTLIPCHGLPAFDKKEICRRIRLRPSFISLHCELPRSPGGNTMHKIDR